jgi:hypothetical protein
MAAPPKLSPAERNKIDPTLQLWLDGKESAKDLELPVAVGKTDVVRVSVEFSDPPARTGLKRYVDLGVQPEAGESVAFGAVTRDQLAMLARDPHVAFIQPVQMKAPSTTVPR